MNFLLLWYHWPLTSWYKWTHWCYLLMTYFLENHQFHDIQGSQNNWWINAVILKLLLSFSKKNQYFIVLLTCIKLEQKKGDIFFSKFQFHERKINGKFITILKTQQSSKFMYKNRKCISSSLIFPWLKKYK